MKNKKGFTVVELVIVIAIIAVLAAVLIPTFASVIRSAKMSSDTQLIRNLNTAIASDKNPHPTMTDVLAAAEAFGYDVSKINASVLDNEILYDSVNEVFCYYDAKAGEIKYTPKTLHPVTLEKNSYKYWRIINAENVGSAFTDISGTTTLTCGVENMNWSCYLAAVKDGVTEVTTAVGVDVGNTTGLTKINYIHTSGDAQDVVIRTNSASTTLTIDDKSEGSIYHYGSAGALNIIECHTASYHEYGRVAFAEIATGRIVLESGSEIKHIHINANKDANGFDTVIIADNGAKALPKAITRDQVDVSEAKAVVTVESGSTSETVYVYPYTDSESTKTGTTEQTETQNTAIATDLGKLVLDNGSDPGEKAMSNNEKTSAKQEVVEVAQNEEAIEKAEEAGYVITHHEAKSPSCTEVGYYAYDSYEVNGEVVKIGYKEIPALGHQKAEKPTYQTAFSGGKWQHATQCIVDNAWIVEYCVDENNDNHCDVCGHQMVIEVRSTADLYTDRGFGISNGYYKLMNDVALTKPQYGNVYLNSNVVIDLNGYTLSNYPLNSPTDAQFRSFGTANSTFVFTLKDSSEAKTGQFMSRFGDHFLYGGQNNGNNKLIIICEDGVTINTSYDYQGNEMNSFSYTGGYFINDASKDIIIRNAHLVIGGIAHVNSGYTITFENCVIESRQSSGFLQSGSGNIVYDGCTITTVMQSSSGNVLDSSDPNVTFINGTTVNGVKK